MPDKNKKIFIYATLITALSVMAGSILSPIEVRFLRTLTDSPTLIGLTFGVGSLALAILSIVLGRLSDKYGRERFIMFGILIGIVYPLLYACTRNVFEYMGIRFAWAFSAISVGPIMTAFIQDILEGNDKKAQYLGYLFSVQSIAGSVGALFGGALSDQYGMKAAYYGASVIFLLMFVVSFFFVKNNKRKKKADFEKRSIFFAFKYIFKKDILVFYFFQNIATGLNWGIKGMLWPLIIYGMIEKDTATGIVFAGMGAAAFLALPLAGKFADKRGSVVSLIVSTVILGFFGLVLASTDNIIIFWAAASLYAIGEAFNGPAAGKMLTENIESKYRGEILGFRRVVNQLLRTLSPFFAGLLLVYFAPQKVLMLYIGLYWVSLFFIIVFYQKFVRKFVINKR